MSRQIIPFAFLVFCTIGGPASAADAVSVGGLVSGKVQGVGFRAFVLRQAIEQNLGGWAVNLPGGRVSFLLQGPAGRVEKALAQIKTGPAKSQVTGVESWSVSTEQLPTFTAYGWTSVSRTIATPHDLVFTLRKPDSVVSSKEAAAIYRDILQRTLGQMPAGQN